MNMNTDKFEPLLSFFKILANEERIRIIGLLAEKEAGIEEIAMRLGSKESAAARHLSKLVELGLVSSRLEENAKIFNLDTSSLHEMNKQVMQSFRRDTSAAIPEGAAYPAWEKETLDHYVDGEEILLLPSGYKKRLVVLKWIADHFEPERKYPEIQVNEIIENHHPDYCTVRREMVDEGMMDRSGGVYWRLEWEMPAFE